MKNSNIIKLTILLIGLFIGFGKCQSTNLIRYKLDNYASYGVNSIGCKVSLGVVLNNDNVTFSSNVISAVSQWDTVPFASYTENGQGAYYITIKDIPYGSTTGYSFNVTNPSNQKSTINLTFDKPYVCSKLQAPFDIKFMSKPLLQYGYYYSINVLFGYDEGLTISDSLTCVTSLVDDCYIGQPFTTFYIVGGLFLKVGEIAKPNISFTIFDIHGGNQTFTFENTIFPTIGNDKSTSQLLDIQTSFPNNTKVQTGSDIYSYLNIVLLKYSNLNSQIVYKDPSSGLIMSTTVVYGTPEEPTLYGGFLLNVYPKPFVYTLMDITKEITYPLNLTYTVQSLYMATPPFTLTKSHELIDSTATNIDTGFIIKTTMGNIMSIDTAMESEIITNVFTQSTAKPTFPYGYNKISNESTWVYTGEISVPLIGLPYNLNNVLGSYSVLLSAVQPDQFPNMVMNDTQPPQLNSIKMEPFGNKVLITMNFTDEGTGLYIISSNQPSFTVYARDALVSGTINNGIYQVLADLGPLIGNFATVSAYDYFFNAGNHDNAYTYTDLFFNNQKQIIKNPKSILDIEYFKFDRLLVDTSFDDLTITLSIKITGTNESSALPFISFSSTGSIQELQTPGFYGVYNKSTGMFDIEFTVPARERGYLTYSITYSPFIGFNQDFEAVFPGQRVLLTANYVDHFAPQITNIQVSNEFNLIEANQVEPIEISWNVTIYDYPVGLSTAYFEVSSNLDFEPYIFNFSPNTSVPGSDTISTYTISIKVLPIVNQTYSISNVLLTDKNGYFSQYPGVAGSSLIFNPFLNNIILNSRFINVNTTLDLTTVSDITPPKLLSLSFPVSFDSFGINRTIEFDFSTSDENGVGISSRHNPYVYLQSHYVNQIKMKSTLVSIDSVTNVHQYKAVTELPYGFLSHGAIVSIHGITDNNLNIASITSSKLKELSFPSYITNPIQARPPVILSTSVDMTNGITQNGGPLFLYGFSFSLIPSVSLVTTGDSTFNTISYGPNSNLVISLTVPPIADGIKFIKVKVISSNSLESNIVTIPVIANPVVVASDCTQYSNCLGNGDCIESKCVCHIGWSGPNCGSSQSAISTKPSETTPSIEAFGSLISIIAIKEMDFNGVTLVTYPLTGNWVGSSINSSYGNSSTAYQYTNQLGITSTQIKVVIDIFQQSSTISFASQQLLMDKGTIKYTISLNEYQYSSNFNNLQLVLNASMSLSDSKCKLNEIKLDENNNIEWIKLRSDSQSLYGKFIQQSIVDYRIGTVENKLLVSPTKDNQVATIGINIPYHYKMVILDPDFSVLLESSDLTTDKSATCVDGVYHSSEDNTHTLAAKGSNLTNTQVIGISVGCAVIGGALVITSIILFKKKIIQRRFMKSIKNKAQQ